MITKVTIINNQIELLAGGLVFSCGITSEGDIEVAKRLANYCDVPLIKDTTSSVNTNNAHKTPNWDIQHPNSLADLDLTSFNFDGADDGKLIWQDISYKNDACPSFMAPANSKEGFFLFLDYESVDERECDNGNRFSLIILPRIDDGKSDGSFELGEIEGDEVTLYEGSDFESLLRVIAEYK